MKNNIIKRKKSKRNNIIWEKKSIAPKLVWEKRSKTNNSNVVWQKELVTRNMRNSLNGHHSACLWFTGISGSGKSTIAHAVEKYLYTLGCWTYVFDGDNVRHGLCSDLDFSMKDRSENIRRIAETVKLFLEAGMIALAAFISPLQEDRKYVRNLLGDDLIEIYCRCPVEVCEKRDVKGLYQKARLGMIKEFTGITSPYHEPVDPDLIIETSKQTVEESVLSVLSLLKERKITKFYKLPQASACNLSSVFEQKQ